MRYFYNFLKFEFGPQKVVKVIKMTRRLKPEWHDTPQTVLISIIEDFFGQADPFDQFILTRVDS